MLENLYVLSELKKLGELRWLGVPRKAKRRRQDCRRKALLVHRRLRMLLLLDRSRYGRRGVAGLGASAA